jgi:hypothetical protein
MPVAFRAREDGYWVVLPSSDRLERWHVAFDGTATLEGMYPALSRELVTDGASRLDGRGRLVQFAVHIAHRDSSVIVRSSLGGDNEMLYDEQANPLVRSGARDLFTGP